MDGKYALVEDKYGPGIHHMDNKMLKDLYEREIELDASYWGGIEEPVNT